MKITDLSVTCHTWDVPPVNYTGVAGVMDPHGTGMTILASPRGGGPGPVTSAVMDGLIVYSVDLESAGHGHAMMPV